MRTKLERLIGPDTLTPPSHFYGRVTKITAQSVHVQGLSGIASIGDQLELRGEHAAISGEVISIESGRLIVSPYAKVDGIILGAKAYYKGAAHLRPCRQWLGRVLDNQGHDLNGIAAPQGALPAALTAAPPKNRKHIGPRLDTGLAAIDTFLPLCRGQRLGLFAGSGVGKSTLLGDLARGADADIVIVALIGERGREVLDFTQNTLGTRGMEKSIVFAATSDTPPALKLRTALLAMASAEYFRDQGRHVLLLFDSLTRYAEAHRSVALSAGETPSLRAFPPSTFDALAQLCERAGTGSTGKSGDITAVFSVLAAGSNMEEPVADMVRGILDGHVVLERAIAERGRYPAIDIRRSVSRALPSCASADENEVLAHARRLIGAYEDARTLIKAGLYQPGSDPLLDEAVQKYEGIDGFIKLKEQEGAKAVFSKLKQILNDETNPEN